MQVTLTKIDIVDKVSSGGKAFKMFEIMTDKHGDKKLTKFVDRDDPFKYVRVGDTVEINEKQNGRFMNFEYVVLRNNMNSQPVIERKPPFYEPPGALDPVKSSTSELEPNIIPSHEDKVDRNYNLLLRIARQVGVILTPEEENDSLGF